MKKQTHTKDGTAKNEDKGEANERFRGPTIEPPEPIRIVDKSAETKDTEEAPKPSYEELEDQLAKANATNDQLKAQVKKLNFEVSWRADALKEILQGYNDDPNVAQDSSWMAKALAAVNAETIKNNLDHPFPD